MIRGGISWTVVVRVGADRREGHDRTLDRNAGERGDEQGHSIAQAPQHDDGGEAPDAPSTTSAGVHEDRSPSGVRTGCEGFVVRHRYLQLGFDC